MSLEFDRKIHDTLANPELQLAIYTATARLKEKRIESVAPAVLPDYQELRTQANAIKKHTIDNLDYYLEEFERNVEKHGGKVVYCKDGTEVADFILSLARERNARLIVKSKSMTTEEVDLNERLEHHGLESVETDLGEYILQLAHERPYHIVAPALHKTRYDVAEIFTRRLNVPNETVIEKQTAIARSVLREKFLAADIGISGANFMIADSGAVAIIENEGNARLTTSAPKIHIAVAGLEKLIPRAQDLAVFLKLLARSATGQLLSVYTSFLSGPRRPGEVDGPDEFYVVLLDNGRTKLLPDRTKRQSLYCIRCGACLNTCPVYRKIGGHSFPWVYSGPIGAIITPQFMGVGHEPGLPFASSLCGACGEVCPVKIDIPKILLELRSDVKKAETREKQNRLEKLAFRAFAWLMTHPRWYELAGRMAGSVAPANDGGWIRSVPPSMNIAPVRALAQPARSSASAHQELPRSLEAPLMARDQILHRVRTALGRGAGQAPPDPPPVWLRIPVVDMDARVESMIARLEALAARCFVASDPCAAVSSLIEGKTAVTSNAPYLSETGITRLPRVQSGITDRERLREVCATADVGITSADYALADTGSLVMIASPQEARLVSLLPPSHIAVVPRGRILTGLDELFTLLPQPAEQTSSMVIITGPSRTADIEQILVRGVHGPGNLTVVIA